MTACPICQKEVEDFVQAHTSTPFTMKAVAMPWMAIEGIDAWGVYSVPKTVLCQNERFVHFRFDTEIGGERLVEMVGDYDFEAIERAREELEKVPHQCDTEGCSDPGEACYMTPMDAEPNEWHCYAHAHEAGFCPICHLFYAGGDDEFDFGKSGLCSGCREAIADENGDYDDDEGFDYADW